MKTSKFCLAIWKANPWPINLFFLANFIAFTIAPLILGYQMQWFFDAITKDDPELNLAVYLVIAMIVLAAVRGVFMLLRSVFYVVCNYVISTMLRRNLFKNIIERRGARSTGSTTGDEISRFRDDVDAVTLFFNNVGYYASFFLFCFFGLVVMWSIDPTVTWVVLVPFVVISIIVTKVKPKIESLTGKQRDATAGVTSFIGSSFSNVESIKAACAEDQIVSEFQKRNQDRRQMSIRYDVFNALISYLGGSMYLIGMSVFLAMVAVKLREGTFSIGEFALFAHFISYLGAGMNGFTKILVDYKALAVNVGRLHEVLTQPEDDDLVRAFTPGYTEESVNAMQTPVEPVRTTDFRKLSVRGLSYSYPHSEDGIADVDLEIRAGELVVLTGDVGSGKTTLLRCLLGHLSAEAGETYWNDEKVENPSQFFVPDRCAYIPQRPQLFSDTLEANILQQRPLDESQVKEVLQQAVLLKDIDRLEGGLDSQVGPNGVKLSGGQIQRTALARLFANRSNLMIADDPVRGLDQETEKAFWETLKVGKNEAFIMATHSKLAIEKADRVIELKNGRIL